MYDKQYHLNIYKIEIGRGFWWTQFDVTKEQVELYIKDLMKKLELN